MQIEEVNKKLVKVTRLEVIDETGRILVNWREKNKIELSLQDDGRTLKVFISLRK